MSRDIITYNPFRMMDEFQKNIFGEPWTPYDVSGAVSFKTDIKEDEAGDKYILEADLPGFAKDDIKLDVDGDILTISAERHSEHEDKDKKGNYVRCERSYGAYSRSFDVSAIDPDKITASYTDGVLKLEMPKKEALIPKKTSISID